MREACYVGYIRPFHRPIPFVISTTVIVVAVASTALAATAGSQLWVTRYASPGAGSDVGRAIGYSADGSQTFVTGVSGGIGGEDYVTIAYDSASGVSLWSASYDGGGGEDDAYALAVSSTTVFVTGYSDGATSEDFATVAYDVTTGAQRWVARYDGPAAADDDAVAIVASRDGSTVYVTGTSEGTVGGADYATIAYRAADGAQRPRSRQ
jgi:hypothetical protein